MMGFRPVNADKDHLAPLAYHSSEPEDSSSSLMTLIDPLLMVLVSVRMLVQGR